MYRQTGESRYQQVHSDQAPFFREAVALIDECTKLPKDDRIALRNKMKDYLRAIRENRLAEDQQESQFFNQLIQIFVEANRKKSLAKIQRGDRAMDWLQIRLRKFIDAAKKDRHRRELENFRKTKHLEIKRPLHEPFSHERKVLGASRGTNFQDGPPPHLPSHFRGSRLQQDQFAKEPAANQPRGSVKGAWVPCSLSRSRQQSRADSSRRKDSAYSQKSYHQSFSFLRKGKEQAGGSRVGKQESGRTANRENSMGGRLGHFNRSVEQLPTFSKALNCKPRPTDSRVSEDRSRGDPSSKEISQLTKLFTEQLNADSRKHEGRHKFEFKADKPKTHHEYKPRRDEIKPRAEEEGKLRAEEGKLRAEEGKLRAEQFRMRGEEHKFQTGQFSRKMQQARQGDFRSEQGRERTEQAVKFNQLMPQKSVFESRYLESSKKLQEMLKGSRQILEEVGVKHQQQETGRRPILEPTQYPALAGLSAESQGAARGQYEHLFTPPDFLAECRKLIASSGQKRQTEEAEEQETKKSFTAALQPAPRDQFGANLFNEVVSENASVNISSKKPSSEVQFQFKACPTLSIEGMLLELFGGGPRLVADRFRIGEIMSRCSPQTERSLQRYCDSLGLISSASFEVSFVGLARFLAGEGLLFNAEDEHFSAFLCSILDMKKNGWVTEEDIEDFLESLRGSQIEEELLERIGALLKEYHMGNVVCSRVAVRWKGGGR